MKQSAHLFWHLNQAKEVKDGDAGWIQMHIGLALKKQCSKPSKFSQTLTKKSHKFAVIHRIAASVWSALALISANYWLSSDASVNKAASVLCTAVQPPPPQQVTVKKRASSWFVTWNAPPMHDNIKLLYQICYGGKDEQVRETHRDTNPSADHWPMSLFLLQSCVVRNVSAGATSYSILESFLAPSQDYRVKVRSLVAPGADFTYMGIPSEWSQPADWTSLEGEKKCFLAANFAACFRPEASFVRATCLVYWVYQGRISLCWFW